MKVWLVIADGDGIDVYRVFTTESAARACAQELENAQRADGWGGEYAYVSVEECEVEELST